MTRSVFFGTPDAAVPALRALAVTSDVVAVITQPDRPRGRSGTPQPPPVKEAATDLGLPVHQPDRAADAIPLVAGTDIGVLVAYGKLIPAPLLAAPRLGMVNLHFSELPRWRGAAPVARAILAGDESTGVTLMQMDEGLDTGPMLATVRTAIGADEDAGALTARLALLGAELLTANFGPLLAGELPAVPQDDGTATVAPKLTTADARIDPTRPAEELHRLVRAMAPRPGAWGMVDGGRFKVLAARVASGGPARGRLEADQGRLLLGTGRGVLELLEVQPEGRRRMAGAEWMRGRRHQPAVLE